LGWSEGSNLRVELRWSAADPDKIRTFAKELVDLRPDAIFGQSTPAIGVLARETRTIPIVFAGVTDPIGSGFAANLAHPGGNITGFTVNDPAVGGKWVELLKEIAPRTVRVALLFNPATAVPIQFFMPSIQAAASSFPIEVSAAPVHAKDEIEGVIAAQARSPGGGLIVMPDAFNEPIRELIIALAERKKRPANRRALKVRTRKLLRAKRSPDILCPSPNAVKVLRGPGSARFTCLLDFRDGYYARSGLLDHFNGDGFDYRSDRLLHFPRSFLRWREFGLGLGDCWLRRLRSLGCLTRLTALS